MAFYREAVAQPFTVILNETLQDPNLSIEATGLLAFMLSLPADWKYSRDWLLAQKQKLGRDKLKRILKELEEWGYLERKVAQDEKGKIRGWDWIVKPSKPCVTRDSTVGLKTRRTGKPSDGKTTTTNKTINKVNKTTTTEVSVKKQEFDVFALALIETLNEMIAEGGWLPSGKPAPKAIWLKNKAETLYSKLPDPCPVDCAVIALKDWTKLVH